MLGKLADLLRDVLRDRERVLVPLGEEMRYARTYLEIAKLRFADRLAYEIDVPVDIERGLVPLFILQPLVENALAHGIGARMRGGRIEITGYRKDDRLHLEVADDGEGVTSSPDGHGVGLSNTRERLKASFGEAQSFSLETTGGKTVAHIVMPLRLVEGITA
jgi:sensor histidine kinase YesM